MQQRSQRIRMARSVAQAAMVGLVASLLPGAPAAQAQSIPTDAQATSPSLNCVVTPAMFNSWFVTGSPSLNGVVKPANSLTFPNTPNCSFYQWSMQMFLWLTSPAPVTYGGGTRVMDSPVFYDVSPVNPATKKRTYIPHAPGMVRVLPIRAAQLGAAGLPVVITKSGQLVQIAPAMTSPNDKPLIRNAAGDLVEIGKITLEANQRASFADAEGKAITLRPTPAPLAGTPAALSPPQVVTVRRFIVDGKPILIDASGNIVETEVGQAGGGGVLEAQAGSLVYYVTMVNDVYAYFQTGVADNQILPGNQFPTTQANLTQITNFAAAHGKTFTDPDALAIEVKSAWVEAGGLPNLNGYVTMSAVVPTYDKSNPAQWVPIPNGQKVVELALVGIHVVGSTAGHPEMIWATFEHFGNTPNAAYTYNSTTGVKTVPQSTAGTWLFAANNTTGPFNSARMSVQSNGDIDATPPVPPNTNGPSETLRSKVWGAASDVPPNPLDNNATNSNTELILINNSIRAPGMLPAADVRNNYFMMGATWTINGLPPTGEFPTGNEVGTSRLANSTMETFHQGPNNTAASGSSNCFGICHLSSSTTISTTAVSHIFSALTPLF